MTFEENFFNAIVSQLLLPHTDQYGNKVDSPVDQAVRQYAQDNRKEINDAVIKHFTVEKIAEVSAKTIIETLKGNIGNSWDRNKFNEDLRTATIKELACSIAKDKMKQV